MTVNAIAPGALTRMTENGRRAPTDEMRAAMGPRWIAPMCTWLASAESAASPGAYRGVRPGARRGRGMAQGPTADPVDDPEKIGPVLLDLLSQARPPADMDGQDRRE